MPFTVSHAVVALPFVRTPLVPAAIAIGAMTPDLPLFVRVIIPDYDVTHDLSRLPITLVMAFVLFLVWRFVLRPAMSSLAPRWVARRLPASWDQSAVTTWKESFGTSGKHTVACIWLVVALAIGIASHIAWDLFTHDGRSGIAALEAQLGPFTAAKWLQYGSSAFGLIVLAVWALRRLLRAPVRGVQTIVKPWHRFVWILAAGVLVLLIGVAYLPLTAAWTFAHWAYATIPLAVGIWGIGTIALCVLIILLRKREVHELAGNGASPATAQRKETQSPD